MTTGVTPADVGKRVQSQSGAHGGWLVSFTDLPCAYVVADDGRDYHVVASEVTVAGPSHPEALAAACDTRDARGRAPDTRDARGRAPDSVREFAEALYALPSRLADTISLHPYAVADALIDLLGEGAGS